MVYEPNYDELREKTPFQWSAGSTYLALLEITGIPIRDFFLDPEAGITLYQEGRPRLRELYGPEIILPKVATPPISYGHAHCLGIELLFPEGGEVNYRRPEKSLEEYIRILAERIDFESSGMIPFYLDYRRRLERAFPGEEVGFGCKHEGPLTTAYVLRDAGVFLDPYDEPETFKSFMNLLTRSIVQYDRFTTSLSGRQGVEAEGAGITDDVSSFFSPGLWPDFVTPYLEQYFRAVTSGKRRAHIEGLHPEHLPFLEEIKLVFFDPSISPLLDPAVINRTTRVPFGWRLANFHYPGLTAEEIRDWVFQAAADGACRIFTLVCATMTDRASVEKVRVFVEACGHVANLFARGADRGDIGELVSTAGKKRFWDNWPN